MANCLNCGTTILENSKFCSLCGQKSTIRSLSFWNLVKDFLSNFFNLETKIWRTLRDIWIPGKLTREYVQGKRVSYYNPIRIFVVTLVSFFTLLLFMINDGLSDMTIPIQQLNLLYFKIRRFLNKQFEYFLVSFKKYDFFHNSLSVHSPFYNY